MTLRTTATPTLTLFLVLSLAPLRARADAFGEAAEAFQRASGGDAAAAARARALFHALAAARPEDPVALAYAGSAATLVARGERSPIAQLTGVEAGLDEIDRAVRLLGPEHDRLLPGRLPARVETLLVAASTFLAVPDAAFHRAQEGKAMVAGVLAHPSFAHLPATTRARFHQLSADAARLEKEPAAEKAALQQVLAADPAGPLAAAARARLAEVKP